MEKKQGIGEIEPLTVAKVRDWESGGDGQGMAGNIGRLFVFYSTGKSGSKEFGRYSIQ